MLVRSFHGAYVLGAIVCPAFFVAGEPGEPTEIWTSCQAFKPDSKLKGSFVGLSLGWQNRFLDHAEVNDQSSRSRQVAQTRRNACVVPARDDPPQMYYSARYAFTFSWVNNATTPSAIEPLRSCAAPAPVPWLTVISKPSPSPRKTVKLMVPFQ